MRRILSLINSASSQNWFSFGLQIDNKQQEMISRLLYHVDIDKKVSRLTYSVRTLFGPNIIIDHLTQPGASISQIPDWPEDTLRLSAIQMLDEPRLIRLFHKWPTDLSPDWSGMTTREAIDELSMQIVAPS